MASAEKALSSTGPQPPPLVLVVAAAILRRGSPTAPAQVLLAQRPAGKALAGLWEFPGGKVDPADASPEAALCRELREELGLHHMEPSALAPLAFASHSYSNGPKPFHLLMPLYSVELNFEKDGGEPRGCEGQALAWASAEELRRGVYALPPADGPLVEPVLAALARLEDESAGRR